MSTPMAGSWVDPGNRYLWNKDPLNLFKRGEGGGGGPLNQYGIDTSSKTYASDTYAAMTRDMWNVWVKEFMPYEDKLYQFATDSGAADRAMADASANVNQAFDAQQGATDRRLRGLGLELTPEEAKASQRSMGIARSLADVSAQNLAGQRTRERQRAVIGSPSPETSVLTNPAYGGA